MLIDTLSHFDSPLHSYPNTIYLSIDQQEELGFRTTLRLPYKSYSRKNIGYLYAIAHGAQVVYETDDDNRWVHYVSTIALSVKLLYV